MLLYHYSKDYYDNLKTLEQQRQLTKEEIERYKKFKHALSPDKPYWKHISFFFDPIPVDKLGKWYGGDHIVWYPRSTLYQYTVDSKSVGDFTYEIVESPEKTQLLFDDSVSTDDYYKSMLEIMIKKKYRGSGNNELELGAKPLVNKTEYFFKKAKDHERFETFKNKYAACVPHVMIYPDNGIIDYLGVTKVTIK